MMEWIDIERDEDIPREKWLLLESGNGNFYAGYICGHTLYTNDHKMRIIDINLRMVFRFAYINKPTTGREE